VTGAARKRECSSLEKKEKRNKGAFKADTMKKIT